ncbi:MAG: hypothetical protein AB2A00_26220 [Myxococcota bacterium]
MDVSQFRRFGTLSLINVGRKHAEKLAAHPDGPIKNRSEAIVVLVNGLEQAYQARRPLRALWVDATARKDAADDALDAAIAALSYDLLSPSHLNKNRAAPEYRAVFPDGNTNFINGPERAQIAHVNGMVDYLRANPGHPMAGRAAELAEKNAALEAALAPQAAAERAYRAAQEVERNAREALFRGLRKSVTFLRGQFDGDEKRVEALYPTVAETKVKEEEGEET